MVTVSESKSSTLLSFCYMCRSEEYGEWHSTDMISIVNTNQGRGRRIGRAASLGLTVLRRKEKGQRRPCCQHRHEQQSMRGLNVLIHCSLFAHVCFLSIYREGDLES